MAHCKSHGLSWTLHFPRRSWLSQARLSLPAPSWVTCFLSSTISLMRLFHKGKTKNKYQGVRSKEFLCSEPQSETAGTNELLDQRKSCWEHTPCPHLSFLSLSRSPLKLWKRFSYAYIWICFKKGLMDYLTYSYSFEYLAHPTYSYISHKNRSYFYSKFTKGETESQHCWLPCLKIEC